MLVFLFLLSQIPSLVARDNVCSFVMALGVRKP